MNFDDDLNDEPEREISLGTFTILGIFLVFALICAAFFGFGYALGRKSAPAAASIPSDTRPDQSLKSSDTSDSDDASPAPNAPAPALAPAPAESPKAVVVHDHASTPAVVPASSPAPKPEAEAHNVAFPVPSAHPAASAPASAGTTRIVVQVSATSRQGDAQALIAALKRKGYNAAIHQEPQDKLYHVQLGPFANRQEANAMRQRLDTDGYKAIVK